MGIHDGGNAGNVGFYVPEMFTCEKEVTGKTKKVK